MAFFIEKKPSFAILMDYRQTVDFLYTRLPVFSRIGPAAYKADLVNTVKLCAFLNNPHTHFKSVHVAGTNGKGSVSHMLAAILQMAGYKTGLYTSPHLKDFRERIRINGKMIPESFVIDFTEKIKPLFDDIEPSFFEITVCMAFDYFKAEKVDIAVIETGLGGRLDSTNVIIPELSVITQIGMDHTSLLGDSLEKIATEKAGIIKESIPVVVGEILPETKKVFETTAKAKNAPLFIASQVRQAVDWKWQKHELVVEISEQHHTDHKTYYLDLPGLYQVKNLLTVLEACHQLSNKGWKLDDKKLHEALRHVKKLTALHGRWEIIGHAPTVVVDVAHNEDGIRQLIEQVELTGYHDLHLIIGFVRDKDFEKNLALLPQTAHYYFTQAHIPRALEAGQLAEKAASYGLKGNIYHDVNLALKEARARAGKDDLVLVCGSVFLVGEIEGI